MSKQVFTLPFTDAIRLIRSQAAIRSGGYPIQLSINTTLTTTLRKTIALPFPVKVKERKILIFSNGANTLEKESNTYGNQELIDQIKESGQIDYDLVVCTPEYFPKITKIARILGPKGLMPTPKKGNVTEDVDAFIKGLEGSVELKSCNTGVFQLQVGKDKMEDNKVLENIKEIMKQVHGLGNAGKKKLVNSCWLFGGIGQSLPVNVKDLR